MNLNKLLNKINVFYKLATSDVALKIQSLVYDSPLSDILERLPPKQAALSDLIAASIAVRFFKKLKIEADDKKDIEMSQKYQNYIQNIVQYFNSAAKDKSSSYTDKAKESVSIADDIIRTMNRDKIKKIFLALKEKFETSIGPSRIRIQELGDFPMGNGGGLSSEEGLEASELEASELPPLRRFRV